MKKRFLIKSFLISFLLVCFSFSGYAQKVSLDYSKVTLKTVLRSITEQTGYNFIYSNELSQINQPISITYKSENESVIPLFDILFKQNGISYQIKQKQVILSPADLKAKTSNPQNQQKPKSEFSVNGKITDNEKIPLPGVSVYNTRTKKGTITDINGTYTLQAAVSDIINYSFVGMESQEITVSSKKKTYDIVLREDQIVLNDVVVTGYQTISKERSSGSFSVVTSDALEKKLQPNFMSRLEGQVAGLTSYKGEYTIRGTSTLMAEKKPLYVLDGIPYEGSLENINPNDIINVSVLKDATAASIYGARSTNGVIVITTRKGAKQKIGGSYNFSYGFSPLPSRSYANKMSSSEFIDYQTYLFENGVAESTKPSKRIGMNKVYELLFNKRDGIISEAQFDEEISSLRSKDRYSQVRKELLNRYNTVQRHNLSVYGGSDFYQYSISLNYQATSPHEKHRTRERLGFSIRNTFNLTNKLTADLSLMANENSWTYDSGVSGMSILNTGKASYYMLRDDIGKPLAWDQAKSQYEIDRLNELDLHDETYYPLLENNKEHSTYKNRYGYINAGLFYEITPELKAEVRFQMERGNTYDKYFYNKESWFVKNMINNATQINENGTHTYHIPQGGQVKVQNAMNSSYTLRGQLNYNKLFNEKHDLRAILGAERRKSVNEYNGHYRYGYDDNNLSYKQINESNLRQGIYGTEDIWGAFFLPVFPIPYQYADDRYVSAYGNAAYMFDNKWGVNGSIRIDQSNLFGTDKKYQYRPLWSLGGHYKILDKGEVSWVDRLSARLTYGINGNVYKESGPYIISKVSPYPNWDTNETQASVQSPPNSGLRWEKTKTTNLGIDFTLLNYRISGSLDYYYKKTSDMIGNRSADPTLGWDNLLINYASMRNQGVELTLQTHNIKTPDFNWNSSVVFSVNKNKIKTLENSSTSASSYYTRLQTRVGKPMNSLYSIRYAGLDEKGAPLAFKQDGTVVNSTSELEPDDLKYSGVYDPPYHASLTNDLRYKNLSLSFMFIYYGGHVMRDIEGGYFPNQPRPYESVTSNIDRIHMNFWKEAGDEKDSSKSPAYNPGAGMNIRYLWQAADKHIQKADYIKLRQVSLSYDVPSFLLDKIKLTSLTLIFQAENIWKWTKNKNNLDPEVWRSTSLDYINRGTAISPTYTFGLNLRF